MEEEPNVIQKHFFKYANGVCEMAQCKIAGPKSKHPGKKYWIVKSKTGGSPDYFRWDDKKLQDLYDSQYKFIQQAPPGRGHFTNHPITDMTPLSLTVSPPLPVFSAEQEKELVLMMNYRLSKELLDVRSHLDTLYEEVKKINNKLKRLDESSSEEWEMTQHQPEDDIGWRRSKKRKITMGKMDYPIPVDKEIKE